MQHNHAWWHNKSHINDKSSIPKIEYAFVTWKSRHLPEYRRQHGQSMHTGTRPQVQRWSNTTASEQSELDCQTEIATRTLWNDVAHRCCLQTRWNIHWLVQKRPDKEIRIRVKVNKTNRKRSNIDSTAFAFMKRSVANLWVANLYGTVIILHLESLPKAPCLLCNCPFDTGEQVWGMKISKCQLSDSNLGQQTDCAQRQHAT